MEGEGKHGFLTELSEELLSTPVGTQNLWEKPGLGLVGWEQKGQGAVPILCPHPMGIQGMLQPLPAACSASKQLQHGECPWRNLGKGFPPQKSSWPRSSGL